MGVITPNEIRKESRRAPVKGGNHVFTQGAMTTIENVIANKNYGGDE